jgi:hypothetical protein
MGAGTLTTGACSNLAVEGGSGELGGLAYREVWPPTPRFAWGCGWGTGILADGSVNAWLAGAERDAVEDKEDVGNVPDVGVGG